MASEKPPVPPGGAPFAARTVSQAPGKPLGKHAAPQPPPAISRVLAVSLRPPASSPWGGLPSSASPSSAHSAARCRSSSQPK